MQNVFLGRQPICDRALEVIAYELLFRSSAENRADVTDPVQATGQVLLNAVVEIGIENVVGDRQAYINLPRAFLENRWSLPLQKDRVVLEVLEDIEPDDELVETLQSLRRLGYRIALDDFTLTDATHRLTQVAEIVKLDVRMHSRATTIEHVAALRKCGVRRLLAEKVETMEEFEWCRELGFDLFQGYFLCRPKLIQARAISKSPAS